MRKISLLGLAVLALLGLVGCGGTLRTAGSWEEVIASEDQVFAEASSLADEFEGWLDTQSLALQNTTSRVLTVVQDSDGITILALPKDFLPPQASEDISQTPFAVTIKCTSSPPIRCGGGRGRIEGQSGTYRIRWTGKGSDGRPIEEMVPAQLELGPQGSDSTAKPRLSYNRIGLLGFWADSLIRWPFLAHIVAALPSWNWTGFTTPQDPTLPFLEALRKACCGLPTEYPKSWPPALLLRDDVVLSFVPFQNPKLLSANSPDDLLGEPLGLLYLRMATGSKLTKADAARLLSVRLVREEPDWILLATDTTDPSQHLRFRIGQVDWCDGCFGQDPPPRYLGIEDRLNGSPLLHLQVGPLMLRGIEKKDIFR